MQKKRYYQSLLSQFAKRKLGKSFYILICQFKFIILYIYLTYSNNIFFARELLFSFDNYFVSRESLQSLSGSEIENAILDIWALRLNCCDLKRSIDQPKRVFSQLIYLEVNFHSMFINLYIVFSFNQIYLIHYFLFSASVRYIESFIST